MKLTVNGETRDLDARTVRDLIDQLGFDPRQPLAVEVNREVVPRKLHDQHTLHDGDQVEIVTLVGGG